MLSVWQRHIWSDKLLFLPMNLDNSIVLGIMIIRLHLAICGHCSHYSKVWVRVNLIRYRPVQSRLEDRKDEAHTFFN